MSTTHLVVDIQHFLRHVVSLEAFHVLLTSLYALLSARRSTQHLLHGFCHSAHIVGVDVYGVVAAGFFKTAASACHNRESALYSLDDGESEALIARGVNTCLCHLVY